MRSVATGKVKVPIELIEPAQMKTHPVTVAYQPSSGLCLNVGVGVKSQHMELRIGLQEAIAMATLPRGGINQQRRLTIGLPLRRQIVQTFLQKYWCMDNVVSGETTVYSYKQMALRPSAASRKEDSLSSR